MQRDEARASSNKQAAYGVVLFPSGVEPPQRPHLLFDPVASADQAPSELMLKEVSDLLKAGEAVLLSCVNRRRRNYAAMVARRSGFRAGVLGAGEGAAHCPPPTPD
jgi:hypothetical protein